MPYHPKALLERHAEDKPWHLRGQKPSKCPCLTKLPREMCPQLIVSKALSWGIIRKSACLLADITIRKSQHISSWDLTMASVCKAYNASGLQVFNKRSDRTRDRTNFIRENVSRYLTHVQGVRLNHAICAGEERSAGGVGRTRRAGDLLSDAGATSERDGGQGCVEHDASNLLSSVGPPLDDALTFCCPSDFSSVLPPCC